VDPRRTGAALAAASALLLSGRTARALDTGTVNGEPVQLDVTETSIVAQHFDARTPPNATVPGLENFEDSGWGQWINRIDGALRWDRLTAGLRLDSAVYWWPPVTNPNAYHYSEQVLQQDSESRFKNSIYPAKMWVTYASPGLEVTVGDAYAQFGRGLTLSMRKIDELGIDTTIRGGKVQFTRDPYQVTAVAGFANPSRVDEATGRALWVTSAGVDPPEAQFGSDRVVGLELQAGRGWPVTVSARATQFTRCAPYAFDAEKNPETDFWKDPVTVTFGTCDAADVATWIGQLNPVPRGLQANEITMGGASIEVPTLWGHGKFYVEGAVQQRQSPLPQVVSPNGNAIYATLALNFGPTSTTVELKSNRNFYTVAGSVGPQASELALIAYTFLPPAESFNMIDAEGQGDFNACVNGLRLREDVSVTDDLLVYGQGVTALSVTEQDNGQCDESGHIHTTMGVSAASVQDTVWDGVTGFEYTFDHNLSHAFVSTGVRDDMHGDGVVGYKEQHLEYSIAKYLGGSWSLEFQGRYRHRVEYDFNFDTSVPSGTGAWWTEGENYIALRVVPKWVFSQGVEFTTLIGQPFLYFNGAVTYKLTSSSNLRLFVGQQRGAFRCASGVCRYFPPFEGARAELTLRF
jgi:hypothetical protein